MLLQRSCPWRRGGDTRRTSRLPGSYRVLPRRGRAGKWRPANAKNQESDGPALDFFQNAIPVTVSQIVRPRRLALDLVAGARCGDCRRPDGQRSVLGSRAPSRKRRRGWIGLSAEGRGGVARPRGRSVRRLLDNQGLRLGQVYEQALARTQLDVAACNWAADHDA